MPTINSKPNNSSTRKSIVFRCRCNQLLKEGLSISTIAKITGASYTHTKNICEQIKNESLHLG